MAASSLTRSTRFLWATICLMCLVCSANSSKEKTMLKEMREQLQELEKKIASQRAHVESERQSTFEILTGNTARLTCLKTHSSLSAPELESIERYTENTNVHVRRSFEDIVKKLNFHESKLEEMKAAVKYAELMSEMQPLAFQM